MKAPASSYPNEDAEPYEAVALAARSTGGVYLAYCEPVLNARCGRVGLWRVGSAKAATVPGSGQGSLVTLSAGPSGRLAVGWVDQSPPSVDVVWTNHAATKFGTLHKVAVPPKAENFDNLAADGTKGPTDLFLNIYQSGAALPVGIWHTQILPALALSVSARSFSHKDKATLTFKVTDVGDPVQGAKVSFDGKVAHTNAKGVAVIKLGKGVSKGTRKAVATVSGSQSASVRITTT